jgi:hypothetical protein
VAAMTDYQTLPELSVNTVAIPQIDLDARIAAAFADGAKSNDVATLIKDTERAAASASDMAEQARNHALGPTLSGSELKDASKFMDDAAFKRDRLKAALGKLRDRLAQLKHQEEDARRQVAYDKAEAVRDKLAAELADLYPDLAQKLAELLVRIAANDRMIEYINGHALPSGAKRLLVAELKARGLPEVANSIETARITNQLCLPPWQPRSSSLWPPRK